MPRKGSGERATESPVATRKTATQRRPTRVSKKATATTRENTPASLREEQIRERAYYIYLERNGAPGDPAADWHQAECELRRAAVTPRI